MKIAPDFPSMWHSWGKTLDDTISRLHEHLHSHVTLHIVASTQVNQSQNASLLASLAPPYSSALAPSVAELKHV